MLSTNIMKDILLITLIESATAIIIAFITGIFKTNSKNSDEAETVSNSSKTKKGKRFLIIFSVSSVIFIGFFVFFNYSCFKCNEEIHIKIHSIYGNKDNRAKEIFKILDSENCRHSRVVTKVDMNQNCIKWFYSTDSLNATCLQKILVDELGIYLKIVSNKDLSHYVKKGYFEIWLGK